MWHWGSQSHPRASTPRYSLAMEFQVQPTPPTTTTVATTTTATDLKDKSEVSSDGTPTKTVTENEEQVGSIMKTSGLQANIEAEVEPTAAAERSSTVFDRRTDDVVEYNSPLTPPLLLPKLHERLKLIAKQIIQYQHMYPLSANVEKLANEILELK